MSTTLVHRHKKLRRLLQEQNLDALALNPGPTLPYLTGLHFHLSERPVVVIFPRQGPLLIVLPELEAPKVENLPYEAISFPYEEDPTTWGNAFTAALALSGLLSARIGVEPRWLRVLELRYLEAAAPNAEFVPAESATAALRMFKDRDEIAAMQKAVDIAQAALEATLPAIRPGVTEREIAAELTTQLLRHGSSGAFPFHPIVSGGPNSANPHATPTDRPLQEGDLLVIDYGANVDGYFSDITRTFALGEVEAEYQHIAEIVLQANQAARAAAGPGVPAAEVDKAARQVIEKAGYGEYFTHRTGHGLGLEVHEEPYIRGDNQQVLQPGMTFTIEPGIYLRGRNGVRIEDDVVITADGCRSLTDLPRELRILPL
ncbi:MAG: aminopeptidase P family protein [Anaerolineae bacterium]|nr:MAG: aminopeptidase P family protein [Anaerolineae bacterium]